jgi:SAM-dependent methyltransferase
VRAEGIGKSILRRFARTYTVISLKEALEFVVSKQWTTAEIKAWVEAQAGANYWYQTIPIGDGVVTPGKTDSLQRLRLLGLPDDLSGKSVLDVGSNSGMLCFECKKRHAARVVGIDLQLNRLEQARTLAEIMGLDIEFREMDLFHVAELGQFDIVFCIAVLTEVADLLGGLEVLKKVTRETLYLELATVETFPGRKRFLGIMNTLLELNLGTVLGRLFPFWLRRFPLKGTARLRQINSSLRTGWSLVPDRLFLNAVMADQFEISDLGMSARYNLFKLTRED